MTVLFSAHGHLELRAGPNGVVTPAERNGRSVSVGPLFTQAVAGQQLEEVSPILFGHLIAPIFV